MKVGFGLLLMLWTGLLMGQVEFYAPDARWIDGSHAYVGIMNPGRTTVNVTLTGFAADGAELGSVTEPLGRFSRLERSSAELFGDTIAWIKLSGDATINGYMRYDRNGKMSITQLSPGPGGAVYNPQIETTARGFTPTTVIANAVAAEGGAQLQPIIQGSGNVAPLKSITATAIPDFGSAYQHTVVDYSGFAASANTPLWDAVTATGSAGLIGMQHFSGEAGSGVAAVTFPRTPQAALTFPALQSMNDTGYWSKLILINTHPVQMPFQLEAHYDMNVTQIQDHLLQGYETMVIDISSRVDFFANANWLRVLPYETGIVGYMMMGDEAGHTLATTDGFYIPHDSASFGYTPTTDQLQTKIGIVNTGQSTITPFVAGFNDLGRVVAYANLSRLDAGQKRDLYLDKVFGDKAANVTWTTVTATNAQIASYALVTARDGSTMAAYDGAPFSSRKGQFFTADFEHFQAVDLERRGWDAVVFPGSSSPRRLSDFLNVAHANIDDSPDPGEFFIEAAHYESNGAFYLAYEPRSRTSGLNSLTFLSAPIEVPDFTQPYLRFDMRIVRPDEVRADSRFGIVWRVEGGTEWHWIGLYGDSMIDPDTVIGDCWIDIQYRNDFVELSARYTFERQLPAEVSGKRIQIGYYYHHAADSDKRNPLAFVDNIRLTNERSNERLTLRTDFYGGGTFTFDEHAPVTID